MSAKAVTADDWNRMRGTHYVVLSGKVGREFDVTTLAREVADEHPVYFANVPGVGSNIAIYRDKKHCQTKAIGMLRLTQFQGAGPFVELRAEDGFLFGAVYSGLLRKGLRLQERSRG